MKRGKCIGVALALLAVSACATLPPPPGPQDSLSAAIGISLVIRPPFRQFGLADRIRLFDLADQKTDMTVYFIRLDDEKGTPDSFLRTTLYRSNYTHGNQVYLLNAAPGRYAAVVVFFEKTPQPPPPASGAFPVASGRPQEFWTYLSEDVIRRTEVTVPPGTIRYMGDFVIDQAVSSKTSVRSCNPISGEETRPRAGTGHDDSHSGRFYLGFSSNPLSSFNVARIERRASW